jgi:hypothetical protein
MFSEQGFDVILSSSHILIQNTSKASSFQLSLPVKQSIWHKNTLLAPCQLKSTLSPAVLISGTPITLVINKRNIEREFGKVGVCCYVFGNCVWSLKGSNKFDQMSLNRKHEWECRLNNVLIAKVEIIGSVPWKSEGWSGRAKRDEVIARIEILIECEGDDLVGMISIASALIVFSKKIVRSANEFWGNTVGRRFMSSESLRGHSIYKKEMK